MEGWCAGNAGVDKSYDFTPTPVLHVRGERTKDAVSALIKKEGAAASLSAANQASMSLATAGAAIAATLRAPSEAPPLPSSSGGGGALRAPLLGESVGVGSE